MSSISYDNQTIEKLIKYLNPERETFKEFIFRDSKGLYKYNGIYPSLIKNYLDISDNYNLENICETIQTKEKNIKLCHEFLFNAILNMNSSDVNKVLKDIKEITDKSPIFFNIAKEEIINNIDHKIVISVLKNLNFKIFKNYNDYLNKNIKIFENTTMWLEKLDDMNKNIIIQIPLFINYLQLLVDYINSNISILNEDLTEFDLDFIYMKKLEEHLLNNYNKNLIYNDIILGYINKLSNNNSIINDFYKKIIINESEKNYDYTSKLFVNIYKSYKTNLQNINITNVLFKLIPLTVAYEETESKLYDYLSKLVKYIMLDKKILDISNIKNTNSIINEEILTKEFDLFLKLKQHFINTQSEFIKKYPKRNFYKYLN
jgi:hypothetical protein